jgi:hypothetical protein
MCGWCVAEPDEAEQCSQHDRCALQHCLLTTPLQVPCATWRRQAAQAYYDLHLMPPFIVALRAALQALYCMCGLKLGSTWKVCKLQQ